MNFTAGIEPLSPLRHAKNGVNTKHIILLCTASNFGQWVYVIEHLCINGV